MIGRPRGRGLLLGGVASFVAVVVGVGLWLLGSPADERRRRMDDRREEDLRMIALLVDSYWSRTESLPGSLDELARQEARGDLPTDPETGAAYEYALRHGGGYELCASFALDDAGPERRSRYDVKPDFWYHGAGRHCFQLEADSEGP